MASADGEPDGRPHAPFCWVVLLLLGTYLTTRGYHSRDGDQAYRLPLLIHQLDSTVYAKDPFVGAFATFNPHRGYLALLRLDAGLLGLSAALAALFAATFTMTAFGIERLARWVWPENSRRCG